MSVSVDDRLYPYLYNYSSTTAWTSCRSNGRRCSPEGAVLEGLRIQDHYHCELEPAQAALWKS